MQLLNQQNRIIRLHPDPTPYVVTLRSHADPETGWRKTLSPPRSAPSFEPIPVPVLSKREQEIMAQARQTRTWINQMADSLAGPWEREFFKVLPRSSLIIRPCGSYRSRNLIRYLESFSMKAASNSL
jgi:hypothetical protein